MRATSVHSSGLNAPFGAQCFPTLLDRLRVGEGLKVSMHLLVLSAFRLVPVGVVEEEAPFGLNAPFGAQCFPTLTKQLYEGLEARLNAPFGAQCFPTQQVVVSVLAETRSQCTFWCSVLSDM